MEDFSICSPTLDRQDCSPRDWPPFSMATKRPGAGGSDVVPSPERKSSSSSSSSSHSLSLAFLVCECVCDHVRKEKTEDPPNPLDGGENSLPAHKDGRLGTHSFLGGGGPRLILWRRRARLNCPFPSFFCLRARLIRLIPATGLLPSALLPHQVVCLGQKRVTRLRSCLPGRQVREGERAF